LEKVDKSKNLPGVNVVAFFVSDDEKKVLITWTPDVEKKNV